MAFGGGGTADYQANLIVNTTGAERTLQSFSGKMSRAIGGVTRNLNANVGQTLRETDRVTQGISNSIREMNNRPILTKRTEASIKALKDAQGAIHKAKIELSDLQRQGKVTTAAMLNFAKVMDKVANAVPPGRGGQRRNAIRQIAIDMRARAAENPGTVGTTQPLSQKNIENAEFMDAMRRQTQSTMRDIRAQNTLNGIRKRRDMEAARADRARLAALERERREQQRIAKELERARQKRERDEAAATKRRIAMEKAAISTIAKHFRRVNQLTTTAGGVSTTQHLGPMGWTPGMAPPKTPTGGRKTAAGGDDDLVRGQLMPMRSKSAAKALLNLGSAAQGAMIGIAALDGNIVGLGFSLIFLSYGIVTVAVAFAALTIAAVATERFFKMIITQGAKAGTAMEKLGQQMSSFFKDAARSQATLTKASGFANAFGIDSAQAQEVTYELEKLGMATNTYMSAIANAAAATGKDVTAVSEQFLAIQKANASEQAGLMEQFSKDFNLNSKKYASSLELAIALNERFAGSAEAAANTNAGVIGKIKAAWFDFVTTVGSVLVGFFRPILDAGLAFVQAMLAGFSAAKKSGIETGKLAKNMEEFAASIRAITPYLVRFGFIMGKVVYYGLLILAKIIKVVADTLIRLWNKIKPVIDTIRAWIPLIKQLIDKVISWYKENKNLIDTLITGIGLLFAFEGGMRLGMAAADLFAKALGGVFSMLVGIWNMLLNTYVVKFAQAGIEAIISMINALMTLIGQLAGKTIQFASSGLEGIMGALRGIGGLLDDIAKKAAAIRLPGAAGEPGAPGKPGTPGTDGGAGIPMPKFNLTSFAPTLAAALGPLIAQAVTLAMAHPLVLAAIGAAALIIGAALFPKETGFITSRAADWIGAAIVTIIGALGTMYLRIIDKFIELQILIRVELAKLFVNAWMAVFDVLKETVKDVFNGLRDIIVGIITGDWERAMRGALAVIGAIFVDLPVGLLTVLKDSWVSALTETVPIIANALWEAFKYVTEPLVDIFKEPFNAIWEWMKGWWAQFSGQWVTEKFDATKRAFKEALDSIKQAFKDIFDFQGSDSIGRIISGAFESLTNFVNRMPNPFGRFMDLMDNVIEKARSVQNFVNAVLPGNPVGGGGGSNSGGGGNQIQQATWVPAVIQTSSFSYGTAANGTTFINSGYYKILRSHWSDQTPTETFVTMPGLTYPDLSQYALGGRVPGRPGTKVPVLADAGEVFLGRPNLARGSGREAAAMGGGTTNVYVDVRGSVVTNDVVTEIANQVAQKTLGSLSFNRSMSMHRIG